jgi:glyoxylase-like metal-dependent hydrolase (beta-lactamase superfamily II)
MVISDGWIAVPSGLSAGSEGGDGPPSYENMDISCLLVRTEHQNILIDTGCGDGFQDSAGKLVANLSKEGIQPADIDTIVYTHGHQDHVGGTFDAGGGPVFPEAHQVVSAKEWECWEKKPDSPLNQGLFAAAREYLLPIREKFTLAADKEEVVPGIVLEPACGHTSGGVMVRMRSGEAELLCVGDLIHSESEFTQPEKYAFLDSVPEEALKLRTAGLAEIAASGTLVFACHFPFPGLGYFVQNDGIMTWQPLSV